jgi:hypothetical protein
MPLARNQPHDDSEHDLGNHPDSSENKDPGIVIETLEAADQSASPLLGTEIVLKIVVNVFLLELGDVKETTVGRVKESDSAG